MPLLQFGHRGTGLILARKGGILLGRKPVLANDHPLACQQPKQRGWGNAEILCD